MRPRYADLAREAGLNICLSCRLPGHEQGFVERQSGIVVLHFAERTWSWPATKRFLNLVARALDPSLDEPDDLWRLVYRRNIAAREVGKRLGIRVPAGYLKLDRAVVLAGVAGIPNDVPFRKRAFDWARR